MAFKMNRSTIKGTASHKASIAKATAESTVRPYSSHAADVLSGVDTYAKSFVPGAIDYGLKMPKIKIGKKKKKKKEGEEEEVIKGCMDSKATNYNAEATESDESCKYKETPEETPEIDDKDVIEGEITEETDYSGKTSDYAETKKYKNFVKRREEENTRIAEENKARLDAESRARQGKATKIDPLKPDIKPISTDISEPELQLSEKAPKSKLKAHENPKYGKKPKSTQLDKRSLSTFDTTMDVHDRFRQNPPPGAENIQSGKYNNYGYTTFVDADGKEQEVWTYNNQRIDKSEVGADAYEGIMEPIITSQEQRTQTITPPSSKNTLIQETTPSTVTEQTLTPRQIREKRMADKKWNNPKTGPKVKAQMIAEGYKPSPAQKRDDRIFRNAKPGGTVQSSLRKSGYIPRNEI